MELIPKSQGATCVPSDDSFADFNIVSGNGKECRTIAPYKPYSAIIVLRPQHFSVLRHFARRFWNQTWKKIETKSKKSLLKWHSKVFFVIYFEINVLTRPKFVIKQCSNCKPKKRRNWTRSTRPLWTVALQKRQPVDKERRKRHWRTCLNAGQLFCGIFIHCTSRMNLSTTLNFNVCNERNSLIKIMEKCIIIFAT